MFKSIRSSCGWKNRNYLIKLKKIQKRPLFLFLFFFIQNSINTVEFNVFAVTIDSHTYEAQRTLVARVSERTAYV